MKEEISNFIRSINQCQNADDIRRLVDGIVDKLIEKKNYNSDTLGFSLGERCYNGGHYNFFITPDIRIRWDSWLPTYHIYGREYLYEFVTYLKNLNLDENIHPLSLIFYVNRFLEQYFVRPKEDGDKREIILDLYAKERAERFYKKHNIIVEDGMTAEQRMYLYGDFPIEAFCGNGYGKCTEWSTLAQNLLMLCGYDSSCMFGDSITEGHEEFHAWNAIRVNENTVLLIDFSNCCVHYKSNGEIEAEPYTAAITTEDFEKFIKGELTLKRQNAHIKNGKRVQEPDNLRYYAVGRSIEKEIQR